MYSRPKILVWADYPFNLVPYTIRGQFFLLKHKTQKNKNGVVHYWISEKKSNALLFLHGATMDHDLFKEQIDYFLSGFSVITIDLPSHGLSTPYSNFSLEDSAEVVIR